MPQIAALKVLTERDAHALAMMVRHLVVAEAAYAQLQEDGLIIAAGKRGPTKHPAQQILRDHSAAFRAYCGLFGLSPADRARLGALHEEEEADIFP